MNIEYENVPFYVKVSVPVNYSIPVTDFTAEIIDEVSPLVSSIIPGSFIEFGTGLYGINLTLTKGNYIIRITNSNLFTSVINIPIRVDVTPADNAINANNTVKVLI